MMLKCCWNVFWTDHLQMMIEMMPLFRKRTRTWKGTRKGVDETHQCAVFASMCVRRWGKYLYVDESSSIDTNGHVYLVHRVNRVHSGLTTDWRRFTLLLVCSQRKERFLSPLRLIPVNFKSSSTAAFHNLV